jgi:hypothetical protein
MPRTALMCVMTAALAGTPASAKDLRRLSALVTPSYAAMSIAVMCTQDDPSFVITHTGPRGTALHYAQHVKDEVIEGLTYAEAKTVLIAAAEAARASARKKLHEIANAFDRGATIQAVTAYCATDGKAMVLDTIAAHDAAHEQFIDDLRAAKESD